MLKPIEMLRPRRKIIGMSAMLLPFDNHGAVDWVGYENHLQRTINAGLTPAVNMDTGYVNLIDKETRLLVLERTRAILAGHSFVAGAYVSDQQGSAFDLASYSQQIELIQAHGGTPIIFQSFGLSGLSADGVLQAYHQLARLCDKFIAFELGTMFAPFGRIYDLATYRGLMAIAQCIGAKHSSLDRQLEWQRLALRDKTRPDFMVLTGNDLAIDMVMYGSDYLLGISTFAPDLFAQRDSYWAEGDPRFYGLNDLLQYLGSFAFRAPVPAYKHSAAQFLHLRGWLDSDQPHPQAGRRPAGDIAILQAIIDRLP